MSLARSKARASNSLQFDVSLHPRANMASELRAITVSRRDFRVAELCHDVCDGVEAKAMSKLPPLVEHTRRVACPLLTMQQASRLRRLLTKERVSQSSFSTNSRPTLTYWWRYTGWNYKDHRTRQEVTRMTFIILARKVLILPVKTRSYREICEMKALPYVRVVGVLFFTQVNLLRLCSPYKAFR